MSGISTYGAQYWSSVLFNLQGLPSSYFLGVVTDMPDESADGTQLAEPLDAAYGRIEILLDGTSWVANTANAVQNTGEITFPTPTTQWGTIAGFVICLEATDGEILCWGEFDVPLYIPAGIPLIIPVGTISIGLDSQNDTVSI